MDFINEISPYIQKYAPQYGIKVCSPIIAQAILESASGTSELAKNAHNYFGLKYRADRCQTSCGIYYKAGSEQNSDGTYTTSNMQWMKFANMEDGIRGYFDFINISNYSNLKNASDPKTYLENIKKDGYATSLNYVSNLLNVINKYNLTKYDVQTEVKPMGLTIKTKLANKNNYGGSRNTSSIKYLVIHYTANDGDTDEANGNYFANNVKYASAHYFVDDDSVTQSVPDNYVAYSVGGSRYSDYKSTGGASLYNIATNNNTINVELCDTVKNGKYDVSNKTLENAIQLAKQLMVKYSIPISNVIRHFDVTGKNCPAYFVSDPAAWQNFKNKLSGSSSSITIPNTNSQPSTNLYRVRKSWADASSQLGAYSSLDNAIAACKSGYSVFDTNGNQVYSKTSNSSQTPTQQTTSKTLNSDAVYRVFANGKWYSEVKNLSDYAGDGKNPIKGISIKTTSGSVKYRVHCKNVGWYPYVTGYNIADHNNGYAGDRKNDIDGVEVVFLAPSGYAAKKAKYRVAPVSGNYYSWQYDNEKTNGQDGYAGAFEKSFGKFQMVIE